MTTGCGWSTGLKRWAGVLTLLGLASGTIVQAADMGWLRAGTRAWWNGGSGDGGGGSDADEAATITSCSPFGATVVRYSAIANWSSAMPVQQFSHPTPLVEGVFWISPHVLRGLTPPNIHNWNNLACLIRSHDLRTLADLQFIPNLFTEKLFALRSPRAIVALSNTTSRSQFFFDVETGLLLSKTEGSTFLTLAEINYDFAARRSYAEDSGAHPGFRVSYEAAYAGKGVTLDGRVISRWRNSIYYRSTLLMMSTSAGGQLVKRDEMVHYDGDADVTYAWPFGTTGPRTAQGSHGWLWIPPGDRSLAKIRVRNLDLLNRGGNPVIFSAASIPSGLSYPALAFNSAGFMTDIVFAYPEYYSFFFDSSVLSPRPTIHGYSYFTSTMGGPAVPDVNQPYLVWTGQPGYESDGVEPDSGNAGVPYRFRVLYVSPAGILPAAGHPQLRIYANGREIPGSPFPLAALDAGAPVSGRTYGGDVTIPKGSGHSYRMECLAANGLWAAGQAIAYQAGPAIISPPELAVDPGRRFLGPAAGRTTFRISNAGGGTLTYAASESLSWANIVAGRRGTNAGTVTVSCRANTRAGARAGNIVVRAPGSAGSPRSLRIVQGGRRVPLLAATPDVKAVGAAAGRTTFSIVNKGGGTLRYRATESASWLSFSGRTSGRNRGTLAVAYKANPKSTARTGTVVVAASGANYSPARLKIVQAGKP